MRIPSLTSLSPKSVYTRFGNRRRTSSTSSASTTASSASVNGSKSTLQKRPSGLNLYELLYSGSGGGTRMTTLSSVGYWSDEKEKEEEEEEGLSVLEPRPRHCVGLFEVLEL
ncbi:hypothetical protein B9Z19DRAFT_968247 [Tuber borchii]|uniref:Uncharacterized protein n=1 Tax=Tuber borchii TaxID=42251 RepID=A0A2T7A3R4_TUBBO|nr:hypothetical protein B9Z19DRAFT_968247 [Tuber borchii]